MKKLQQHDATACSSEDIREAIINVAKTSRYSVCDLDVDDPRNSEYPNLAINGGEITGMRKGEDHNTMYSNTEFISIMMNISGVEAGKLIEVELEKLK